jgi:hypothetical protein
MNAALLLLFFGILRVLAITAFNDDTQKNMQNTGEMFASIADGYIHSKYAVMNNIINSNDIRLFLSENAENAHKPIKSYGNYSRAISALNSTSAVDADVVSSWIVSDSKGFLLTSSGYYADSSSFNMNSQQWYSKIISNAKDDYCWVSSIIESIENNSSVITFVSPVIENGNIIGYAGMEVSSDSLFNYVDSYYFQDGIYPFIILKTAMLSTAGLMQALKILLIFHRFLPIYQPLSPLITTETLFINIEPAAEAGTAQCFLIKALPLKI